MVPVKHLDLIPPPGHPPTERRCSSVSAARHWTQQAASAGDAPPRQSVSLYFLTSWVWTRLVDGEARRRPRAQLRTHRHPSAHRVRPDARRRGLLWRVCDGASRWGPWARLGPLPHGGGRSERAIKQEARGGMATMLPGFTNGGGAQMLPGFAQGGGPLPMWADVANMASMKRGFDIVPANMLFQVQVPNHCQVFPLRSESVKRFAQTRYLLPAPPWRQPGGKTIVSLVNSHTNATSSR